MKKNLTIADARTHIFTHLSSTDSESVEAAHAAGRRVFVDVPSLRTLPGCDNSAMDGYAVRAEDIKSASASSPVSLQVVGVQICGGEKTPPVTAGKAVRIMTGAPVSEGADCVVMREHCDESGVSQGEAPAASGVVLINKALPVREAIRFRGEDILKDKVILHRGDVLTPARMNLLLAAGHSRVECSRTPKVAILSSGDELLEIGQPYTDESVVNSNAYAIKAACERLGVKAELLGIARDTLEDHAQKIESSDADVLLTIGGVSMGTHDFVKPALERAGYDLAFWKVAMRPGKPLVFGTKGGRVAFGLPGNPVSSLVSFMLFVAPALKTMMGEKNVLPLLFKARLEGEGFRKRAGVVFHARANVTQDAAGEWVCTIGGKQSSGQISGMAHANALCVIDSERTEVEAGERVQVMWL